MAYDPDFLDNMHVPLPTLGPSARETAFEEGVPVDHLRHSLVFNAARGFATYTAHNIDGGSMPDQQYTNRSFKFDPKVQPETLQVDDDRGYHHNPWDRGHLVRRASMSWGEEADAAVAERESDFYTNIAPQHSTLHSRSWGRIEDWMLARVEEGGRRACVFTGPVFTPNDPLYSQDGEEPIRIPAGFWKIVAVKANGQLRSAGFLVWQRDYDSDRPLPFEPLLEQVRLTTIEVLTDLSFAALRDTDPLLFGEQVGRRETAPALAGTRSMEADMVDRLAKRRPVAILDENDIVL